MSDKRFTFLSFLKNMGIMAGIFVIMIVFFFYIYLPSTTNHGETITVPELVGMSFDDLEEYVVQRNLRYEIMEDSGFSENFKPLAILTQNPQAGAKVKENRKIYLSLNATVPPTVKMPSLINTNVENARDILESHGLKLGSVEMVPHRATNSVLAQKFEGEDILQEASLPKGSYIDLTIADGEGLQNFETPDFTGKTLDEVKFQIQASRLKLDIIFYQKVDSLPANLVYKQLPPAGRMIKSSDPVEIWINSDEPEEEEEVGNGTGSDIKMK